MTIALASLLLLATQTQAVQLDYPLLFKHLQRISSDEMAGRQPGTEGHKRAQNYIVAAYKAMSLTPLGEDYRLRFNYGKKVGVNLAGMISGTRYPEKYVVVTAHYDHLGQKGRSIFNGADDNASGVASMLAIAKFVSENPVDYSIIFLATDAEEGGLRGAKAFVKSPPVPKQNLVMNFNIDMIANGGKYKRFYIAGTRYTPEFKACLKGIAEHYSHAGFNVRFGHDRRGDLQGARINKRDWRKASDHYPFLKADIPYLYFGVSEHPHYHSPEDTFENLDKAFFQQSAETIFASFKRLTLTQNIDLKNATACLATIE